MKRIVALLLAAVLLCASACAEYIAHDDYTDVPTAMTQDSVLELTVDELGCMIEYLQPDEESIALLDDVYDFVWEEVDIPGREYEKHRPARYYDPLTQEEIARLAGCDIDILHMTEAMRLQLSGMPLEEEVREITAEMLLDVDYHIGQLVIVVMGIPQYPETEADPAAEDADLTGKEEKKAEKAADKAEKKADKEEKKADKNGAENQELPEGELMEQEAEVSYIWYPYRGRVEEVGEIEWDIPLEDWIELSKQPVSFHVLTNRIGPRGERLRHEEEDPQHYEIFSKDAGDVIHTNYWYTESGEPIEDNFRIWLTDLTEPMQDEVLRIAEYLEPVLDENGEVIEVPLLLDYFPEERRDEALLMLPEDVDPADLIAYDVIALQDEEYKDTYGDVNVEIDFATQYMHEKAMVVLAGFPLEEPVKLPLPTPTPIPGSEYVLTPEPTAETPEPTAEPTPDPEAEEEWLYMEWFVLRAEAVEPVDPLEDETDRVDIGLKQLNLPRMEEEPMMLIVISEDLAKIELPEETPAPEATEIPEEK